MWRLLISCAENREVDQAEKPQNLVFSSLEIEKGVMCKLEYRHFCIKTHQIFAYMNFSRYVVRYLFISQNTTQPKLDIPETKRGYWLFAYIRRCSGTHSQNCSTTYAEHSLSVEFMNRWFHALRKGRRLPDLWKRFETCAKHDLH